jgi:large subunit ribosomal protein L9
MKVILKSDIKGLGGMGEVVSVKDGYARNFLLPKGLVTEANPKNIRALEHEQKKIQDAARKLRAGAEALASRIASMTVTIMAKAGEEEKLFGSVTAMDIAEALKKEGLDIDRKKIVLDEPIKRLGNYAVNVKIHSDVITPLTVVVIPEES